MDTAERKRVAGIMEGMFREAGRITGRPPDSIIGQCCEKPDGSWVNRGTGERVPATLDNIQDIGPKFMRELASRGVTPAMIEECKFNLHPVDECGTTVDLGEIISAARENTSGSEPQKSGAGHRGLHRGGGR